MAINLVRGFRRIGWVVTFPVATFIVLALYERTKEFSPSNYEVAQMGGKMSDLIEASQRLSTEVPDLGKLYFSPEVPIDVASKIRRDFEARHKPPLASPLPPKKVYLDEQGNPLPEIDLSDGLVDDSARLWTFTVHKQVSQLKLAGLVAGSVVISVLIIQGSISILAWVFRGFKG